MLVFREEKSPEDETKAWQFWHSRQHSVKQRILDAGESKDSFYLYYFPSVKKSTLKSFAEKIWDMPHAFLWTCLFGNGGRWWWFFMSVFSSTFFFASPPNKAKCSTYFIFSTIPLKRKYLYHSTWYDYYYDDARNTLLSQIPFFTQNIPKNPNKITTIIIIRLSRSSHHH